MRVQRHLKGSSLHFGFLCTGIQSFHFLLCNVFAFEVPKAEPKAAAAPAAALPAFQVSEDMPVRDVLERAVRRGWLRDQVPAVQA